MSPTSTLFYAAHELLARQSATETASAAASATSAASTDPNNASRPPIYKVVGIILAIASGCFIGVSFVLKKMGLLKANEKYNEVAGEGYGYLKNAFWWTGMTLMIIGEICNFVAYAFVDAILVTPLGALSVVITTILSAIFLKERLSLVGKVGCFLCIVGSIVILMNAPAESSAANIQQMQGYVIAPGFLSYAGVIIIGCAFIALWVAPRYGKKSMLVYLSICSLIGGLSVVATQGLGAAVVAQAGGTPQFNQWFLYVLFVFVIATLLTEIIYLNKALNIFNAALVTPTYYVFFTSSTIITSAILFRGFHGTVTSIITVVLGFLVICSGVVLLQLSKSAKDVPDTAVFAGDLDQVRTIAEQEQPETEPKADAIRGAAGIIRRISVARQKMEENELKRLHEEKQRELEPIGENEQFEWDGLRRRRTTVGSISGSSRRMTTPRLHTPQHLPLGWSHMPTEEELADEGRPLTAGLTSAIGTIRQRAKSIVQPRPFQTEAYGQQSPMHPVPLTEIHIPSAEPTEHVYGLPPGLRHSDTEYKGAGAEHVHFRDSVDEHRPSSRNAPPPPPHQAKRQFSFHNVFHRKNTASPVHEESNPMSNIRPAASRLGLGSRSSSHTATVTKGATEEERLGLVKGDTSLSSLSHSLHPFPHYGEGDEFDADEEWDDVEKRRQPQPQPSSTAAAAGRNVVAGAGAGAGASSATPPSSSQGSKGDDDGRDDETERYKKQAGLWKVPTWEDPSKQPPPPPGSSGGGAFI